MAVGFCWFLLGRDAGIRTRDPLNPIQVRYQTAPRPDRRRAFEQGGSRKSTSAPDRQALINVAPVRHPNDQDDEDLVTDLVDDPVVAGTDPIDLAPAFKRLVARRAGVVGERINVTRGLPPLGRGERLEFLQSRGKELDPVASQRPSRALISFQGIVLGSSRSLRRASSRSMRSSISSMSLRSSTGTRATTSLPRRSRTIRSPR